VRTLSTSWREYPSEYSEYLLERPEYPSPGSPAATAVGAPVATSAPGLAGPSRVRKATRMVLQETVLEYSRGTARNGTLEYSRGTDRKGTRGVLKERVLAAALEYSQGTERKGTRVLKVYSSSRGVLQSTGARAILSEVDGEMRKAKSTAEEHVESEQVRGSDRVLRGYCSVRCALRKTTQSRENHTHACAPLRRICTTRSTRTPTALSRSPRHSLPPASTLGVPGEYPVSSLWAPLEYPLSTH
jgi:hypothetical protein